MDKVITNFVVSINHDCEEDNTIMSNIDIITQRTFPHPDKSQAHRKQLVRQILCGKMAPMHLVLLVF